KNVICFAGKSFLTMAMCKIVEEEGYNLDVASMGELFVGLKAGFPRKRINLHGNNKSREELQFALKSKIGHIVVDNFLEIEMLRELTLGHKKQTSVLVRCSPGVDPHTHKAISTGQADTKFGFNIKDGSALEGIRQISEIPGLHFDGIHCHVGSQLLDNDSHLTAIDAMIDLMASVKKNIGLDCAVVNIGGGLGVRYLEEHNPPSAEEFAESLVGQLITRLDKHVLGRPVLQQEPGRSIVAEAGTTLYTVGSIKTVPIKEAPKKRTYVSVDGGLSDNPRPQLYEAEYSVLAANRMNDAAEKVVTVAGKHCETDTLFRDVKVPDLAPGDILAVQTTGAYNHVMASNYNKLQRPAVVLVNNGRAEVIVERETLAEIIKRERIPARLAGKSKRK
ncbi:MAG: diaminopimelate decarboxylase, partial [Chthonomonadales bacterium]